MNNTSVQFIAIGALLFGLNDFVQPSNSSHKQDSITIKKRYIDDLFSDLSKNKISKPSLAAISETKSSITQKEIEQEVLYREALVLNLDKGDQIIRRHLIQKMDFVLTSKSQPSSPPTEDELHQWWQQHQENYQAPQRFSFYHVYLEEKNKTKSNAITTQLLSTESDSNKPNSKNTPPTDAYQLGDPFLHGHYFKRKTLVQIGNLFGKKTATHLATSNENEWLGPIESQFGLHWVYLEEKQKQQMKPFEEIKEKVYQELQEHTAASEKRSLLDTLVSSYNVSYEE